MKLKTLVLLCAFFLSSCAASYHSINPPTLTYLSNSIDKSLSLDYKFNLLPQKYAKKETKFNVKLIAVKLTNNSGRDLVFGKDIKLTYGNGGEVILMDDQHVYAALRQKNEYYLFYLLLTAATINTTTNGQQTSSIPVGYALGPGLTATNMLIASSANKSFNDELLKYNIIGATIKNGATIYGLVGINSASFEGINVKVE